jgi:probable phosphoglycerate mutase
VSLLPGDRATLILVKHAAPEIDPDRRATAWPLSFEGRRKVADLTARLEPYAPDQIVASPTLKAFETGRILAEELFIPIDTHPGLQEQDRRSVPWLTTRAFREGVHSAMQRPEELVFGDETAGDAVRRFESAIDEILAGHPHGTVVIVTHGTVMSLFLGRRLHLDPFDLWGRLEMPAFAALDRDNLELVELATRV